MKQQKPQLICPEMSIARTSLLRYLFYPYKFKVIQTSSQYAHVLFGLESHLRPGPLESRGSRPAYRDIIRHCLAIHMLPTHHSIPPLSAIHFPDKYAQPK
ncbi:hypothetical protein T265_12123 [Opisthorchis viverrini]|uniref:Uncharacterized protein n=1 Tax=Opisthorchis viverrini TaxID=6198 RepID=A0A074YVS0_OPIVI|nr:hypothetical protein T265_12123 [Opisthorchis viverrini]KER18866.1 hypothetical protein T265_12123 [Opisthorchis viverrini]